MRQPLNLLLALGLLIAPTASVLADDSTTPEHHHEKKLEHEKEKKLTPLKPTVAVPHAEQKKPIEAAQEKPRVRPEPAFHRETPEEKRRHEIERRRLHELEIARERELARLRGLGLPVPALVPIAVAPADSGSAAPQGTDAGATPQPQQATDGAGQPGTVPVQAAVPQQSQPATQLAATPVAATQALAHPGPAPAAAPAPIAPSCLPEIAKAEKRYGIPEGLLVSISLVESGRSDPDTGIVAPWPWTIDTHGEGQYFDTIDAAAAAAGALLAANDGLVDVGCMQVDLYHHPHAFQTLLAAFDPETNVDYAARYLVQLKGQSGSWASAIGAYHTGNPETGGEYVARVLYYWKNLGTTATKAQVVAEKPGLRGFVIDTRPAPLEIAAGFVESKDYPAASAIYRAILSGAPDDQMAMLGLAQTMQATGHNDEAREQLERLLTENPGNRAALASLLVILDAMPPPQRLTALLSARQVVPTSGQIPARLAMLEQERGNPREALAQMAAAVRLEPGDPVLRLDYALMLDKGGYRAASIDAYTQFLEHYRPGSVALTVSLDQIKQRLFYLRAHTP